MDHRDVTGRLAHTHVWMDQGVLREVQYASDGNVAARQAIYAFERPRFDLPAAVIGLLGLTGAETVVDIGCGNGLYLAELAGRGHRGPVLGVDLSPGMLAAARTRSPGAAMLSADAAALPLRPAVTDLSLAMHMLYHVPDPAQAVAELRRVTRPGGRAVIGLNAGDHLAELRRLIHSVLVIGGHDPASLPGERIRLDDGEVLAGAGFSSVTRHDFRGELVLTDPGVVTAYVRSLPIADPAGGQDRLAGAVAAAIPFGADGSFRVTTHAGVLVCA